MSKINVLVIPSDKSGVGKYRSIDPHVILQNQYPDDFHIDILFQVPMNDMDFWKKYQIVHFHRTIAGDYENTPKLLATLRSLGIVTIMDLDDYWLPGKEHPIHDLIVTNKIHEKIINNLRSSEYVMTTTPVFATEILKLNKNVVIFPNAINAKEPQFNEPTLPSDKLRFGWLGGSSHLHDLTLLESIFGKIHQHRNDAQFYVCGFDIRGTVTEINKQTEQRCGVQCEGHKKATT